MLLLFSHWVVSALFFDPVDRGPPGSSVHGISQARILEWVAISFSGDLPNPEIEPTSPALADRFFTTEAPGKPSSQIVESKSHQACRSNFQFSRNTGGSWTSETASQGRKQTKTACKIFYKTTDCIYSTRQGRLIWKWVKGLLHWMISKAHTKPSIMCGPCLDPDSKKTTIKK